MARRHAAALALAVLAGCYRGPGTDSPNFAEQYPHGIVQTSPAPSPSGISSKALDGPSRCCWLGREATFSGAIPAGSDRLRLNVYLPEEGPYDKQPESVTVAVEHGASKTFANLRSGIYSLELPLDKKSQPYDATVHVTSSYTFNPLKLGISGDNRDLAFELKSVQAL